MHTSRLLLLLHRGNDCVLRTDHEVSRCPGCTLITAKVLLHEIFEVVAYAVAVKVRSQQDSF